jgi:hypothetical protein
MQLAQRSTVHQPPQRSIREWDRPATSVNAPWDIRMPVRWAWLVPLPQTMMTQLISRWIASRRRSVETTPPSTQRWQGRISIVLNAIRVKPFPTLPDVLAVGSRGLEAMFGINVQPHRSLARLAQRGVPMLAAIAQPRFRKGRRLPRRPTTERGRPVRCRVGAA